MEIKINKSKMWKRLLTEDIIIFIFYFIGVILLNKLFKWLVSESDVTFLSKVIFPILLIGIILISGITIIYHWLITQSMKYEISDEKLVKTYQAIVKTKDQARLQIVNSVDIRQNLIDKIFDLFYIDVSYGFSGEGYNFTFPFLSEQEADRIGDMIKPTGKSVDIR